MSNCFPLFLAILKPLVLLPLPSLSLPIYNHHSASLVRSTRDAISQRSTKHPPPPTTQHVDNSLLKKSTTKPTSHTHSHISILLPLPPPPVTRAIQRPCTILLCLLTTPVFSTLYDLSLAQKAKKKEGTTTQTNSPSRLLV
ncbi:hypothetical protein PGT21_029900 [Puccinia graminis f. sp. tritici]|uniref:Uncharacterized protein n=1 Tax=Puccinia graminis f. sp. tritici TaxID=56615 RepID=A0A5B0MPS0_PUCGR|nr:hypothetical protein PGT21_029900 [Puccinia graminis f. sp. tritici]KAA1113932.1 hypothetical protein PGTUg99_019684 [Puccinia graminis f. sp. tritici]